MSDRELLEIYMRGFTDELDSLSARPYEGIKLSAYTLGRNHAFIGDDVRSVDSLTNDQILEMIRKIDYKSLEFTDFCKLVVENTKSF